MEESINNGSRDFEEHVWVEAKASLPPSLSEDDPRLGVFCSSAIYRDQFYPCRDPSTMTNCEDERVFVRRMRRSAGRKWQKKLVLTTKRIRLNPNRPTRHSPYIISAHSTRVGPANCTLLLKRAGASDTKQSHTEVLKTRKTYRKMVGDSIVIIHIDDAVLTGKIVKAVIEFGTDPVKQTFLDSAAATLVTVFNELGIKRSEMLTKTRCDL
jgi:hypothetical protein